MVNHNQLIIEKVENGFIIAIQSKTQTKSSLFGSSESQIDKKHLVAKDVKEVQTLLGEHLKNLITANESRKLLEAEADKEDED